MTWKRYTSNRKVHTKDKVLPPLLWSWWSTLLPVVISSGQMNGHQEKKKLCEDERRKREGQVEKGGRGVWVT